MLNTLYGPVAQLVRAPPCHGGGRGFESHPGRAYMVLYVFIFKYGILAQLGEHLPYKQRVIGSSPIGPIECIISNTVCIIRIWMDSRVAKGDRL